MCLLFLRLPLGLTLCQARVAWARRSKCLKIFGELDQQRVALPRPKLSTTTPAIYILNISLPELLLSLFLLIGSQQGLQQWLSASSADNRWDDDILIRLPYFILISKPLHRLKNFLKIFTVRVDSNNSTCHKQVDWKLYQTNTRWSGSRLFDCIRSWLTLNLIQSTDNITTDKRSQGNGL